MTVTVNKRQDTYDPNLNTFQRWLITSHGDRGVLITHKHGLKPTKPISRDELERAADNWERDLLAKLGAKT